MKLCSGFTGATCRFREEFGGVNVKVPILMKSLVDYFEMLSLVNNFEGPKLVNYFGGVF